MGGLQPGREEGKRKIADGRTDADGWRRPKSGEIPREEGTVNLHKFDILGESGAQHAQFRPRPLSFPSQCF